MNTKTYLVKGDSLFGPVLITEPNKPSYGDRDSDSQSIDRWNEWQAHLASLKPYCRQSGLKEGSLVVEGKDFRFELRYKDDQLFAVPLAIPAASVSAAQTCPECRVPVSQHGTACGWGNAKGVHTTALSLSSAPGREGELTAVDILREVLAEHEKERAYLIKEYPVLEKKIDTAVKPWVEKARKLLATAPVMQQGEEPLDPNTALYCIYGAASSQDEEKSSELLERIRDYAAQGLKYLKSDHTLPTPASNQNEQEEMLAEVKEILKESWVADSFIQKLASSFTLKRKT